MEFKNRFLWEGEGQQVQVTVEGRRYGPRVMNAIMRKCQAARTVQALSVVCFDLEKARGVAFCFVPATSAVLGEMGRAA